MSDQGAVTTKPGEALTQRMLGTMIGELDRSVSDGARALREVESEIDKLIGNRDKLAEANRVTEVRKRALRAAIRVLEDEGVI